MRRLILAVLLSACGKPEELATSQPSSHSPDGSPLVLDDVGRADEPCALSLTTMPKAPPDPLPELDNEKGWRPAAPLHRARYRPFTQLLPDGRVLVAGGTYAAGPYPNTATAGLEIYDVARDAWSVETEWPAAEPTVAMAMLDAARFVALTSTTGTSGARLRLYDFGARSWSVLSSPPRRIIAGATLTRLKNGELLLVGGDAYSDSSPWRAFRYDPRRNSWRAAASMNFGRVRHRAALLDDGRLVVVGGQDSEAAPIEIYDALRDQWTAVIPERLEDDTTRWDYSLAWIAGRRVNVPPSPGTTSTPQQPIRTFDLDCGRTDGVVFLPGRIDAYAPVPLAGGDTALIGGETRAYERWGSNAYATPIVSHVSLRPRFLAPLPELRHEPTAVALADGSILAFGGSEATACERCETQPEAWILDP